MGQSGKIIGAIILLMVMAIAGFFYYTQSSKPTQSTLKGLIGGEKTGLLDDQEVQKIMTQKYGITLDYSKAGSIEMVQGDTTKYDFLFPSSQVAVDIYKSLPNKPLLKTETIFNSPIVLYSWDKVTDALIKEGIVKKSDSAYYIVNFPKLVNLVNQGKKWSDIGLPELYGKITITSTDPTKSNSGNQFAGLLANILNGDVVDETTVQKVLPTVKQFFARIGYMESSSSDLFEEYLRTGMGAKPIIVGYENQIIEFAEDNKDVWPQVKDRIRILYPVPTVWSAHTLMVLKPEAKPLITALSDKEIQRIAWEKHGFRTGLAGATNDPKKLKVAGIPQGINQVVPMPNPKVMETIINSLKQQ